MPDQAVMLGNFRSGRVEDGLRAYPRNGDPPGRPFFRAAKLALDQKSELKSESG